MFITACYLLYLALSIAITIWVAKNLHANGRIFLVDAFGGNEPPADSVNRLLATGFYLINFGWITLTLRPEAQVVDTRRLVETLTDKVGGVLLVLGTIHFATIFVFSRMRSRAGNAAGNPPPVPRPGPRSAEGVAHDPKAWRLAD